MQALGTIGIQMVGATKKHQKVQYGCEEHFKNINDGLYGVLNRITEDASKSTWVRGIDGLLDIWRTHVDRNAETLHL